MRTITPGIPWITTHNPFDGDAGEALYVSPAGVIDASQINYRNLRLLPLGPASVCVEFPAIGDGPLGLDAHVALVTSPDPLTWELPEDYLDSQFAINVRPHADGLQLDTISGWQLVSTAGGEADPVLTGTVVVHSVTKLDGGGVRVWFGYYDLVGGDFQPTSFAIRDTGDPVTIDTVSIDAASDHNYYVELSGLADATDYTFAIVGLVDDDETELTTFDVTGDDEGPDVDSELTAEAW